MQSLLKSLNCYIRFIEDFAIYASVLYELREADFHEIRRMDKTESLTLNNKAVEYRKCRGDTNRDRISVTGGDPIVDDLIGQGEIDPERICVAMEYTDL